jgi:ribosomal-protein-alanine N-acetyltransferase
VVCKGQASGVWRQVCRGQVRDIPSYNAPVEFRLRDFRREDFGTLWAIDQECFPPGIAYSKQELAEYMRHSAFASIAESAEAADILGFIVVAAGRGRTGHVITIDVRPKARRFGVGSRLLVAAEECLRNSKCMSVSLETAVDNASALAFYKQHKYEIVKTLPEYYSNGVDAFVMQKDLLSPVEAS